MEALTPSTVHLRSRARQRQWITPIFILLAQIPANSQASQSSEVRADLQETPRATGPFQAGTALPDSCDVGESFLKTDASGRANWYECKTPNVWQVQSASSAQGLGDFLTALISPTTLSVAPGTYGSGSQTYAYGGATTFTLVQYPITSVTNWGTQSMLTLAGNWVNSSIHSGDTIYISGAVGPGCTGMNTLQTIVRLAPPNQVLINWNSSGCVYTANSAQFGSNPRANGIVYLFGDYAGNLTLDFPAAAGLIAVGRGAIVPITIQETQPGFASDGVPLASIQLNSASAGTWGAVTNARAFLARSSLVAGTGMSVHEAGGVFTVAIDRSTVPELGGGNAWTGANDFASAESTAPFKVTAQAPLTCSVGQYYFNNANKHTYACTAQNAWTQVDGGARTTTETRDLSLLTCGYETPATIPAPGPVRCGATRQVSMVALGTTDRALKQATTTVPFGWSGGPVQLHVYGAVAEGAGSPIYRVQTQCYDPADSGGVASSNAPQTLTAFPNPKSGDFMGELNLTMAGCAPGNVLHIVIAPASTHASDQVYGAYLTIERNL
jgi:hypothetical protein